LIIAGFEEPRNVPKILHTFIGNSTEQARPLSANNTSNQVQARIHITKIARACQQHARLEMKNSARELARSSRFSLKFVASTAEGPAAAIRTANTPPIPIPAE